MKLIILCAYESKLIEKWKIKVSEPEPLRPNLVPQHGEVPQHGTVPQPGTVPQHGRTANLDDVPQHGKVPQHGNASVQDLFLLC